MTIRLRVEVVPSSLGVRSSRAGRRALIMPISTLLPSGVRILFAGIGHRISREDSMPSVRPGSVAPGVVKTPRLKASVARGDDALFASFESASALSTTAYCGICTTPRTSAAE